MPWFLCFQSFVISYLEVGLNLSWDVLCLLWMDYHVGKFLGLSWTVCCLLRKDYYVDLFPSAARKQSVRIMNPYQGQAQGEEVATSSTACCFGCMLSMQIKQQSSTSGVYYCGASSLEMEKEDGWSSFRYAEIEVFHPSRFLCGWSWLSTSASATDNFLQSWLPCE